MLVKEFIETLRGSPDVMIDRGIAPLVKYDEKTHDSALIVAINFTSPIVITIRPNFSDWERSFLKKCLNKKWKWLAKDKDGISFLYKTKPVKENGKWQSENGWQPTAIDISYISWKDDEPYLLEKLLGEEE